MFMPPQHTWLPAVEAPEAPSPANDWTTGLPYAVGPTREGAVWEPSVSPQYLVKKTHEQDEGRGGRCCRSHWDGWKGGGGQGLEGGGGTAHGANSNARALSSLHGWCVKSYSPLPIPGSVKHRSWETAEVARTTVQFVAAYAFGVDWPADQHQIANPTNEGRERRHAQTQFRKMRATSTARQGAASNAPQARSARR